MDIYSMTSASPYMYLFGAPDESTFDSVEYNEKWLSILSKLLRFKVVEPDWDREGAAPPSEELVDSLLRYLLSMRSQNTLAPDRILLTNDGSIIVEWQGADYIYEIETSAPGFGELMYATDEGEPEFRDFRWEDTSEWSEEMSYTITPGGNSDSSTVYQEVA